MTLQTSPSKAFTLAAIAALITGMTAFLIGLVNAKLPLNEKGYYFAMLILGLYSAVSVQKSVRDKIDGIPVTRAYYLISWIAVSLAIAMLAVGLYNAQMALSEKGFYTMAYVLALFAAITVQKNVRDKEAEPEVRTAKTVPQNHGEQQA